MAARTTSKDRGPDGAKPGEVTRTPADGHAFDADARIKARRDAAITIGGKEYRRVLKNWKVSRQCRALGRRQERANFQLERIGREIEDLPTDADEEKFDSLMARVDDLEVEAETASYEILVLLLRGPDDVLPDIEEFKEALDGADLVALVKLLMGGGELDPTQTTPSSSG